MMSSNGIQCIFDHISSHVEPRLIAGDHHANSGIYPMHSFTTIKANTYPARHAAIHTGYRGRMAPTPSGALHMGHAATFRTAFNRAKEAQGTLILRIEDIDLDRCSAASGISILDDLRWLGLNWDEGPDIGGPVAPYRQSECTGYYISIMQLLAEAGAVYPCPLSRTDIQNHPECTQSRFGEWMVIPSMRPSELRDPHHSIPFNPHGSINWRFRVPSPKTMSFRDNIAGSQSYAAGIDFGDFLVWRKDGTPAYELAVVADDIRMGITEVVRGADLLLSTCRQLMIYEALHQNPPSFAHCPLILDAQGKRLAKSLGSETIRSFRERGILPSQYWNAVDAALRQSTESQPSDTQTPER